MYRQNLTVYNPVLGMDSSTSDIIQRLQARRQERMLQNITPQVQPRVGMIEQFIRGTTDPVNQLLSKLNIVKRRETIKPQGIGENVSHFLGELLGFGAVLAPWVAPIATGASTAVIGALSSGAAAAGASAAATATAAGAKAAAVTAAKAAATRAAAPLLAKAAGAAASGAIYGGLASWLEDEPIIQGALTRAATGGAFSVAGAGVAKLYNRVKQVVSNPLDKLLQKSVMFPKTKEEIDNVLRLMQHVPDAMKGQLYKDTLKDILDAAQPGGPLAGHMTPAQLNYFTQQHQTAVGKVDDDIGILLRVLRRYPGGEDYAKDIIDTTGQAAYGPRLKSKDKQYKLVQAVLRRLKPTTVPPTPTLGTQLPAEPWRQGNYANVAEVMPVNELDKFKTVASAVGTQGVTQQQWDTLKHDILANGIQEPVVLGYDPLVRRIKLTDGNLRLAIAKDIGLTEIPVRIERVAGGLTKATGAKFLRSGLYVAPNIQDIKPSQVFPAHRLQTPGLNFSQAAQTALNEARNATNLQEQLAAGETFYREVRSSYKGFLQKSNYASLEALLNDPNAKTSALKAAQRHLQKRDMAQDLLWNIKGQFNQGLGLLGPKDLPSLKLSAAFAKAPGTKTMPHKWHYELIKVLHEVNDKTGKSYSNYESMLADAKAGDRDLLPYLKKWKQVEHSLKQRNEPLYMGIYSNFVVPLPPDIEQKIAQRRASPLPQPPAILSQVATTVKQQAAKAKAQEAYDAAVKKHQEYNVFDFVSEMIEAGEFTPADITEEKMLTETRPFGIFSRLIPVRYLFGKTFSNAARQAGNEVQAFREKYLGVGMKSGERGGLRKWLDYLKVRGKERAAVGKRIGDLLENTDVNQKTLAAMMKYDDNNPIWQKYSQWASAQYGLSAKELRVASEMRGALNSIFKDAGLDDARFIEAYFPHFRKMDEKLNRAIGQRLTGLMDDGKRIMGVKWVNSLIRSGNMTAYEEDAFVAFSRYVNGASKSIHYDNLFNTWTKTFKSVGVDKNRMLLFEQLKASLLGRPSQTETQIDEAIQATMKYFGFKNPTFRPSQAITSFMAEMQYLGGIAGNPFAVAKNLTQKILFLPDVVDDPDKWHTEGIPAWYKYAKIKNTPAGQAIDDFNQILHSRQFAEGMTYGNSAIVNLATRLGASEVGAQKTINAFYAGYRWADLDNVKDAFGTQFLRLMEKGAPIQEAIEIATSTAMSSQFMYGFDSPMLYKTAWGKLAGVFMSWPLNWAMMMFEQGTEGNIRQAFATVGAMAVGSAALSLTGYNFMSTHPVAVARGILPVAMLEGQESWPVTLRTGASALEALRALAKGDETEINRALEDLKRRVEPMIPLGVPMGRVVRFIDIVQNDWKQYDLKDRYRRDVPVHEGIRSILGPTIEAQERYQDYLSVQRMESNYRRLRSQAIKAYMDGNVKRFRFLQEQLLLNYGDGFIEPADIEQELKLRSSSAIERQLVGLPASVRDRFMQERGYTPTVTERRALRSQRF